MERTIRNALAQHTTEFSVGDRLHDVPPHLVYAVTIEGRRAICKVATGPAANVGGEVAAMRHAREAGLPVPRILATGPDHYVAAWCDHAPEPDADPTADRLRAMADALGRLRAGPAGDFARTGFLRAGGVEGHDSWSATLCALLDGWRDSLEPRGHADVARETIETVRAHRDALDGVDPPALLHGNVHPAHVGESNEDLTCLIDFEHALVGLPEYDFMRTVVPVFLGALGDAAELDLGRFRARYESHRPLPPGFHAREPLYRQVLSVSYLVALYVQQGGRADPEAIEERAAWIRARVLDAREEVEATLG
jgi:aminoglycoside phosphotransferase (APT) family kinase protein